MIGRRADDGGSREEFKRKGRRREGCLEKSKSLRRKEVRERNGKERTVKIHYH